MGNFDSLHAKLDRGDGTMTEAFRYYESFLRNPNYEKISGELRLEKHGITIEGICFGTVFIPIVPQIILAYFAFTNEICKYIFFTVLVLQVLAIVTWLSGSFIEYHFDCGDFTKKVVIGSDNYSQKRRELENKYNVFIFTEHDLNTFASHYNGDNCHHYKANYCCIDGHKVISPEEGKGSCYSCPAYRKHLTDIIDRVLDER